MTVPVDTLSGPTIHPKLIFSTNFGGGMSVNAVTMLGTAYDVGPPVVHADWGQGWSHINSSDTGTGYGFSSLTSYFGAKTLFYIQQLPVAHITGDVDNATSGQAATTLATLMTVAIQDTSMTVDAGGKELALTQIQRNGSGNPQSPLLVQRYRDDYPINTIPIPHTDTIAWEFDCTLDSDINNLTADDSHYCVISEMKTGDLRSTYPSGSYSSSVGSYRFGIIIKKGASGLYYSTYLDNVANAVGVYPAGYNPQSGFFFAPFTLSEKQISTGDTVKGGTSGATGIASYVELRSGTWTGRDGKGIVVITGANGTFQNGEKLQAKIAGVWTDAVTVATYHTGFEGANLDLVENKYRINNTSGGSVDLNTTLHFQIRLRLPSRRTDITTGLAQVAVTNISTKARTTLCDFRGGIQCGAMEDPLTRLMIINPYTNLNDTSYPGDPTIGLTHKITNLKIWSDFPYPIV